MKLAIAQKLAILMSMLPFIALTSSAQCISEENVFPFFYEGTYYEVITETKTWGNAATCAVERGGYLVEINSKEEQDTIYQSIIQGAMVAADYTVVSDGGGIAYVWIGASDQHLEGTWIWDGDGDNSGTNFWNGQGFAGLNDGAPVEALYNNWGGSSGGIPNEPDNFGSGQDGAAIGLAKWPAGIDFTLGVASEWNDISSDNLLYFVVEYDCVETLHSIDTISCDLYVSPGGKTWTSPGTYMDTIINADGCDSVITINLDFHTIDTSLIQDGLTLTANTAGAMYQWLDCENNNSIIEGETGQSLSGISGLSYSVEITENGCIDTSSCHTFPVLAIFNRTGSNQLVTYQGTDKNVFFVDLGDLHDEVVLRVSDLNGRIILEANYHRTRLMKFTITEPPGIYFITVKYDQKLAVARVRKD